MIRETLYAFGGDLIQKGLGLELRKDFEFEEKFPNATTQDLRDYYNLDTPPDTGGGEGQPWHYGLLMEWQAHLLKKK